MNSLKFGAILLLIVLVSSYVYYSNSKLTPEDPSADGIEATNLKELEIIAPSTPSVEEINRNEPLVVVRPEQTAQLEGDVIENFEDNKLNTIEPLYRREIPINFSQTINDLIRKADGGDVDAAVVLGKGLQQCAPSMAFNETPFEFCLGMNDDLYGLSIKYLKQAIDAGDAEGSLMFMQALPLHIDGFYEKFKSEDEQLFSLYQSELKDFEMEKVQVGKNLLANGNINAGTNLALLYQGSDLIRTSDTSKTGFDYDYEALKYALISHKMMNGESILTGLIETLGGVLSHVAVDQANQEADNFINDLKANSIQFTKY